MQILTEETPDLKRKTCCRAKQVVHLSLGMGAWLQPINDNRTDYATVNAIMYGPLVLAALTLRENTLDADPARVTEWLQPAPHLLQGEVGASAGAKLEYEWRVGALARGDDLGTVSNLTRGDAQAHCDSLGDNCTGFCYLGGRGLRGRATMMFKADTAGKLWKRCDIPRGTQKLLPPEMIQLLLDTPATICFNENARARALSLSLLLRWQATGADGISTTAGLAG